ncbi:response regulator transcription factor [Paucibacter sp. R3-3]|uniref:Response regulator transcription factor n=1 Tax=Roseateles agri TaxID=3098619 RepID=A0ABU5DT34_9BURK|nr:response regulator transcription factor [Paucibacter sp. R3-3]MDY0749011.1 response regulator transcription factor [Paucibacter sp. R3-3]
MPISVLCIDDHALLREGIAAVLQGQEDFQFVADAATAEEGIERFRVYQPAVTLLDIQMPGVNGIEALVRIRKESPSAKVIMLTTYKGDAQAARAIAAGAADYLLKSSLHRELREAIRIVHAGRRHVTPEVAAEVMQNMGGATLSQREIEVLQCISNGNSNKIAASRLKSSEETVKVHLKNISAKLGAKDRTHAVVIALRRGIIDMV